MTLEAFADAVDQEIRVFDTWCAERESQIMQARLGCGVEGTIVSLLETEKAIRDRWEGSFNVLVAIVKDLDGGSTRYEMARLLDSLFDAVAENTERGETIAAEILLRVFCRSAEPVWAMIGKWLRVGGGQLEDEFFIELGFGGVGIGVMQMPIWDPAFWEEGYVLRGRDPDDPGRRSKVPIFFESIARDILGTGKSVGLMKALGVNFDESMLTWSSFLDISTRIGGGLMMLDRCIHEEVGPFCQSVGKDVVTAIMGSQCDFRRHLKRIQDLFFWRGEDGVVSLFGDTVFAKVGITLLRNLSVFHPFLDG